MLGAGADQERRQASAPDRPLPGGGGVGGAPGSRPASDDDPSAVDADDAPLRDPAMLSPLSCCC